MKLALIIPTRNRKKDIRNLLSNLSNQTVLPDQVIIVDSSDIPQTELKKEFPSLSINYSVFEADPSAARQRNAGLQYVSPEIDLIGFVDDDMIFEPDAMEKMLDFWQESTSNICGTAFNWVGYREDGLARSVKSWRLTHWLGLYPRSAGGVAASGWHDRIREVKENIKVEWLTTGAVIWRADILQQHKFDKFYEGYSYLEDLDFSYGMSRHCDLVIVANARVHHLHHHAEHDAEWLYSFGRMEVCNRFYFVRKYNLSIWRCCLVLVIRFSMTLAEALKKRKLSLLSRAKGNLVGVWESLFQRRSWHG